MPWHWEPTKDVTSCDKPRGGANIRNNRGFPNVGTHMVKNHVTLCESNSITWGTPGTETSKYREEEKSNEIPRVVASESGRGQTWGSNTLGVRTVKVFWKLAESHGKVNRRVWESLRRKRKEMDGILSICGHEESAENMGGPSSKPKYYPMTDSGEVPWGKGEKNRGSGVKRTWNHMFTST